MKNANMPAMPVTDEGGMPFNEIPPEPCTLGLTKREHFAAMAMQGLLASGNWQPGAFSASAVRAADELLEELERTGGEP